MSSIGSSNKVDDYVLDDHLKKSILILQLPQKQTVSIRTKFVAHLLNTPDHLKHRVRTWVDKTGLDLIHNCIVNDRSDILELIFTKTELFPQGHSPAKNPYAHLAACFGLTKCLQMILKHRPMDYFRTLLPSHEISLTNEQTKKLEEMSRGSGEAYLKESREFKRLKKLLRDILLYCREEAWGKLLIDNEFGEQLQTSQADLSDVTGKFANKKVVIKQELGGRYVTLPAINRLSATIDTGSTQRSTTSASKLSRTTIVLPDIPSARDITQGMSSKDTSVSPSTSKKDVYVQKFLGRTRRRSGGTGRSPNRVHERSIWGKNVAAVLDTTTDKTNRKGTLSIGVFKEQPDRPSVIDIIPKVKRNSNYDEQFTKVAAQLQRRSRKTQEETHCLRLHNDNISVCDLQGGVIKGAGKPLKLIEQPMILKLKKQKKSTYVTNEERIDINGFDKNTTVLLNCNNNATYSRHAVYQDTFSTEPETSSRIYHNHSNNNARDSKEEFFQDVFRTETSFHREQNKSSDGRYPMTNSTTSLLRGPMTNSSTSSLKDPLVFSTISERSRRQKDSLFDAKGQTPLSLAAFRGHGECIHVILDYIIGGDTSLLHATEENSPLAIVILLSRTPLDLQEYKAALFAAVKMQLPSCLSVLIIGNGNKDIISMRNSVLNRFNLYHLLYSQSLHRRDGWYRLVEMTNMMISSGIDVNPGRYVPGTCPLYTLVNCAFNQAPIHNTKTYLECFAEMLNAGANPTYNENRKQQCSTFSGACAMTGFELECSRANFSSAIECIIISARSSLQFDEHEEWCKTLMTSFIQILIASVPSGYNIDVIFKTYVLGSAHIGFNANIIESLLRKGLDPSKEIDDTDAMNMYFNQMLPYLVRNNVPDCFFYYKPEIDTLLAIYRRVSPPLLKKAFLSFFDNQTENLPVQAIPILRYFNHEIGQLLTKPRRLEDMSALSVWDGMCDRQECSLGELKLSDKLVSLILPKIKIESEEALLTFLSSKR